MSGPEEPQGTGSTRQRGKFFASELAAFVTATVHPSSILRADAAAREAQMAEFVRDLRAVADKLHEIGLPA